MKAVVKLTGHLFDVGDLETSTELHSISNLMADFNEKEGNRLFAVTGGGPIARRYIQFAKGLGASEEQLDLLGIAFTKVNAQLLIALLGPAAHPEILNKLRDVHSLTSERIVTSGGLIPGISTNAVSALIAEAVGADILVTLTRVGGLFNKDPSLYKDAELIEEVRIEEVRRILSVFWERAGEYPLLDQTALNIINRSRIPTLITLPKVETLSRALMGEKTGTRIVFD